MGNLLTKYDGTTITSDNIGNMLSDGTWTYTWQNGRQLATMTNGTTNLSFKYDSNGIRTEKKIGNTTWRYIYDGSRLVYMTNGSLAIYFRYDAEGNPMCLKYKGANYFYLRNAQNDIVGIVDSAGALVVEYTYDAWGKPLSTTGSMATTLGASNPFRYRGYVYDTETGLYYLQSRYYDPEMGRFINADAHLSTGDILNANLFAYCSNNPINRVDYNGYFWQELWSSFTQTLQQASSVFAAAGAVAMADSPAIGPADMAAALIAGAAVTVCAGVAIYNAVSEKKTPIVSTRVEEKDVATTPQSTPSYWKADLVQDQVQITDPLTLPEASIRVAEGGSIMCRDQSAAVEIIIINGYRNAVGPEKGSGKGFYSHYHPTRNHKGYDSIHIWFYE